MCLVYIVSDLTCYDQTESLAGVDLTGSDYSQGITVIPLLGQLVNEVNGGRSADT